MHAHATLALFSFSGRQAVDKKRLMSAFHKDRDLKSLLRVPVPSCTIHGQTVPLLAALERFQDQVSVCSMNECTHAECR
jgi:hypothetical protein